MAGGSPVQQMGSTGSERDGDRTSTSSLSWVAQLQAYLRASQGSTLSTTVAQQRKLLGDVVLENPNAAEAWLKFLQHEESIVDALAGSTCWVGSKKLSLMHWYQKATELVQRSKGQAAEAYVAVWLGYARHQWSSNEDEARDTFKTLRNLQIASGNAQLYYDWAVLEAGSGKPSKALGVLHKGISGQAQPLSLLTDLLQQLQQQTGGVAAETGNTATIAFVHPVSRNSPDMLPAPMPGLQLDRGGQNSQVNLEKDAPLQLQHSGARAQRGASVTQHSLSSSSSGACSAHTQHTQHQIQQLAVSSCHTMGSSKSGMSMMSSDEDATVSCHKGALDGNHTLTSAGGDGTLQTHAAGMGAGNGNNTLTMNVGAAGTGAGIKRFGFKSKALRVSSNCCSPADAVVAAMPVAAPSLSQQPENGQVRAGEAAPGTANAAPPLQQLEATAASRKRRPELPGSHSPCSLNPASVMPDDTKRRNSPDASMLHSRDVATTVKPHHSAAAVTGEPAAAAAASVHVLQPAGELSAQARDENCAPADVTGLQQCRPASENKLVPPPPPLFDGKPSVFPGTGTTRAALQPLKLTGKDSAATGLPAAELILAPTQPAIDIKAKALESNVQASQPHTSAVTGGSHSNNSQPPAAAAQASMAASSSVTTDAQAAQVAVQPSAGVPPERLPDAQRRAMEDGNWVYVSGLRYQKLDCVGRGGSSKVFKVLGCNRQIYALKRVRMSNKDPEAIRGFIDEIALLKQLRSTPNIIQLISAQVFREEGLIYMVLEYGDIDLARLLHNHEETRKKRLQATGLDENFIRLYWQQMLQAVQSVHELRIVHSDLKPANFMLVQGQLKLIDFGIAKSIQGDTTSISREAQVGTLNYMSPEAIQGGTNNPLGGPSQKVGRPSDVWSLGCILYQMIYGRTPFADLPFIPKMNAICNPAHMINFPPCCNPAAVDVMRACLDRNPRTRATIHDLLQHPFLHPERARTCLAHTAAPATAPANAVAEAGSVDGVSEAQLKTIVSQIAQAGASGSVDIDHLTRQVLQQLTAGTGISASQGSANNKLQAMLPAGRPPPPPPPPPAPTLPSQTLRAAPAPPPPPPPPPLLPQMAFKRTAAAPSAEAGMAGMAGIAAAAAAAAAARQNAAGTAGSVRATGTMPNAVLRPKGMPMGAELQAAILQQRTQLRPVGAADAVAQARAPSQEQLERMPQSAAPSLDTIIRKSLQRIQQQQQVLREDDTGATEFLQKA